MIKNNYTYSKPFYSNCLFQALKHKVQNWHSVKIRRVSAWQNYKRLGVFKVHFYWIDVEKNIIASFSPVKKKARQLIFFKGHISSRPLYKKISKKDFFCFAEL